MCPRHVGGRYPTPGFTGEGLSALSRLPFDTHDLTQRVHHVHQIALRLHHCIDGLVGHIGVSSMTSASLRHSTPAVALAWSSSVNRRLASVRAMARPAPWLQLMKLSGLPLPRTMYERAPMLPGMSPMSPSRARTAPLRVMSTFSP